MFDKDHYQVELTHPADDFIFSIKSAKTLDGQLLQKPNQVDFATSSLILHKVSVFGRYFKVVLKHLGDFIFRLDTVEEVTD